MTWVVWAMLLLAQQGSSTWSSRTKAQKSTRNVVISGIFSNGVWIVSQFIIIDTAASAMRSGKLQLMIFTAVFYTFFCVAGNAIAHRILLHTERGKLWKSSGVST